MLIESAYAQTAAAPAQGGALMTLLPLFLMLGVFWLLVMRPQMKREQEKRNMQDAVRRGDKVITLGGIVAEVTKVEDDHYLEAEIAEGTVVRMAKASVEGVITKGIPKVAKAAPKKKANGKTPAPKAKAPKKAAKKTTKKTK